MKRKFTDEDILRFLFDEMDKDESDAFLSALCSEESLWERYEYFQEVVEKSSGLKYEPSEEACQNVMAYVEATSPNVPLDPEKTPYLLGLKSSKISLNAVLMFVLALFGSITIIGSVYQMQKFEEGRKQTNNFKEEQVVEPTNWDDANLEWENSDLEDRIKDVEMELQELKIKTKDPREL